MAQNISKDQSELSQYLQLLYHAHSFNPQMPYLDVPDLGSRDNETQAKKIIRFLDTIAVALTTGKPGEVFAVGLDKTSGFKLILAKNGPHTDGDNDTVSRLLDILKDPETDTVVKVLPFLLAHCKQNINKRVRKMIEALGALEEGLEEALENHIQSSSLEEEFPSGGFYFDAKELGNTIGFVDTMRNLWSDISEQARAFLDLTECHGSVEEDVKVKSFVKLAMFVTVLEKSPFLHRLCNPVKHWECVPQRFLAEKLKRRLAKVCQYYQGVHKLVRYTKRIPADSISYCWVSPITGTGQAAVHLDDCLLAVSQILHPRPLPNKAKLRLQNHIPKLKENWPSDRSIETCVHAEIRVLLHLDSSPNPPDHTQAQPIGCSKRTCLCCTLWINAYNESARTSWLTGSSGGKSYAAWALPGHLHANGSAAVARCMADDAVMRGVKSRLDNILELLLPNKSRSPQSEADARKLEKLSLEFINRRL